MEQLLALIVFGVLGAISLMGYVSNERAARGRERSAGYDQDRSMTSVGSD